MPVAAHRDAAVLAYGASCLLALLQIVGAGPTTPVLSSAAPYVAALTTVLLVRRAVATGDARRVGALGRRALGWGLVGLAGWALVAFLWALPTHLGEPHGFYRVKLAVATPLGDHNTVAGLLLVGVVVCAGLAAEDRRWLAGGALIALGMVATLSRGAAVVLVLVALAGLVLGSSPTARAVMLCSAVAVAAGVLLAASLLDASPPPGAAGSEGPVGPSVLGRVDLATRGFELGLRHPLRGVGLGAFAAHAGGLPPPDDHAHQLLAHAFAEGGLVLLLVAAAVPSIVVVRGWRWPPGPLRDLPLLGATGLVAHAQFEILGGRLGYEVLLAAVAALVTPRVRSALHDAREPR
jgi:hypothetical protein